MKKAILFGASGFIGSHLLEELLVCPDYQQVTIVVRKPLGITHAKLKMLVGDYNTLPKLKSEIQGDEIFVALGSTQKQTPQRKEYYEVDHDYPLLAAKIAKENGVKSLFIVTAIGSNSNSRFFYVKTKGEVERDIQALDFQHTHIFQPSMIFGQRSQERPVEKSLIKVWGFVDKVMFGKLNQYKGIDGRDVAKAMIRAAQSPTKKIAIYRWSEMMILLGRC